MQRLSASSKNSLILRNINASPIYNSSKSVTQKTSVSFIGRSNTNTRKLSRKIIRSLQIK